MSSKVAFLRTQTPLFVTGWGDLKTTLPTSNKTFIGLSMSRVAEGVEVSATGRPSFVVPWGNIVHAELAKDEEVKSQAV